MHLKKITLSTMSFKITNNPESSVPMILLRGLHKLSHDMNNISKLKKNESESEIY